MSKFGLVGFPLSHSFSKKYFEDKFKQEEITNHTYTLFPLPSIHEFSSLLATEPQLKGLNVTIPYKESIINYLNGLDETAKAIGAVNCIKITNNYLKGFNTDAPAFEQSLKSFLTTPPQQTFVLGTGGSAKAVCYALQRLGIPYVQVSREPNNNIIDYGYVSQNMKASNLFINTTPLGMFPAVEGFPHIPYTQLSDRDFLFDLVYNPEETTFLKHGKEHGAQTQNGLEMLYLQAEKSWEIWNE